MGRLRLLRGVCAIMLLVLSAFLSLELLYQNVTHSETKSEFYKHVKNRLKANTTVCKRKAVIRGLSSNPGDVYHCSGYLLEQSQQQTETHFSNEVVSRLRYGGVYKPNDGNSSERTAIIIPYRDRPDHLKILLDYLHNFLQRQQIHYGIFVVEMALPTQFNRGLLANAGFLTARSIGKYTCYIIHDVDLLPTNINNLYKCGKGPRHLITNATKYDKGIPYRSYVGGVLAMTSHQFMTVNGYSNLYFGWGGEDDDMSKRIKASKLVLERPEKAVGTFINLNHIGDASNPRNPHKKMLLDNAEQRQSRDGLSSMRFQRQALEFRQKYTWILVKADEREIMEGYPWLRAKFDFRGESHSAVKDGETHTYRKKNNRDPF